MKCAWVEGLDPRLFVGRTVVVCRVPYDVTHGLNLHAVIAKRHAEEGAPSDSNPPYRLTTSWQWATITPAAAPAPGLGSRAGTAASITSEMTRPGTTASVGTTQGDIPYPAAVDE